MGSYCTVLYLKEFELAGRVGFEPTVAFTTPVFKTGAFNRSAISRKLYGGNLTLEAPPGFEPGIRALQARALPLGYGAV